MGFHQAPSTWKNLVRDPQGLAANCQGHGGSLVSRAEHYFRPAFRVGGSSSGAQIPCSAAQLHILLLLENLKQQQFQLANTVKMVLSRLGSTPVPSELPEEFQFPLDNLEEVEDFENWIRENRGRKQNLVSALAAVEGPDPKKVTWNILARLYSCSVAKKINWKGVNGKRAFHQMGAKVLLMRAVWPVTERVGVRHAAGQDNEGWLGELRLSLVFYSFYIGYRMKTL
ncbi:uncharacterized protein LOC141803708 [Halichoeres trimaculatus]|uniref:uncharacterized protein LOC141803708 n=1 Tax=Halichoeres trimaculatus TaxID=147232 RepID=UPI003D9E7DF6